jgi:uncharacterized membrane protein required for colicin V production
MIVDIACLVCVALFFLAGLFSGFLKQVVRIVALLSAFLMLSPVSHGVRDLLSGKVDVTAFPGNVLVVMLAWLAGYVAVLLMGKILLRVVRGANPSLGVSDRFLGGMFGAVKGGMIVFVLVSFVLFLEDPVSKLLPEFSQELKCSRVALFVKQHDLLSPWVRKLEDKVKETEVHLSPLGANMQVQVGASGFL